MVQCTDLDLVALLDADEEFFRVSDSGDEIASHVESCELCRSRLEALAADEAHWREAGTWLSPNSDSPDRDDKSEVDYERRNRPLVWTETMARTLLAPPIHPEMLGRLGRYDVERLIGSGGMGVVFKAYDTELNRPVAIKMLAPYLAENGSARKRFAREARAAAAVVDDHVVPIHNVDSQSDRGPFLVMQYIAGGSLQQRLDDDGPLELRETLRIGMQTAKGLAAAHAQGLIHRDIKPSNILLDEGVERALLTDFGLARASDDANLTRSGFHPGTPHFMSPEQVRGEAIDTRSDLFGLGCLMYAMCTGHPPFCGETSYAVMRRTTEDAPRSIREINSEIPEWLNQIVMKLLAKKPEDRFGSADEVAELLEGCLAHVQQPTVSPLPSRASELSSTKRRSPRTSSLVAVGILVMLLFFAGIAITLELNKGTLTIETNGVHDVPIRVTQGDKVYARLTVSQDGASVRLMAGRYRIEIEGNVDNYEILGDQVTLKRGSDWIAKVSARSTTPKADTSSETTASWPELQGDWRLADLTSTDNVFRSVFPSEKSAGTIMEIRGNKRIFVHPNGTKSEREFTVNRKTDPATIDFVKYRNGKHSRSLGIIALSGDKLLIAFSANGSNHRPASFDSPRVTVMSFVRTSVDLSHQKRPESSQSQHPGSDPVPPVPDQSDKTQTKKPNGRNRRQGNSRALQELARQTISKHDRDGDRQLDKNEAPLGLRRGFDEIDTDDDDRIDEEELTLRYRQSSGMLRPVSSRDAEMQEQKSLSQSPQSKRNFATPEALMRHFSDRQFHGDLQGCLECYSDDFISSLASSYLLVAKMMVQDLAQVSPESVKDRDSVANQKKLADLIERSLTPDAPAIASAGLQEAAQLYRRGYNEVFRESMRAEQGMLIASSSSLLKDPKQFIIDFNSIGEDGDDNQSEDKKASAPKSAYRIKRIGGNVFAVDPPDTRGYELRRIDGSWLINGIAEAEEMIEN